MRSVRQTELLIGIGLLLAALVANAAMAFRNIADLHDDATETAHRREAIRALDQLFSAVQDAETGQRGYLITGEDKYLKPYHQLTVVIAERIARVASLTRHDPEQQSRIARLQQVVAEKEAELAETIALRTADFSAAQAEVKTDKGRNAMEAIRRIVGQMQTRENRQLDVQQAAADESFQSAKRDVIFAALLGFVAVGGFLWLLRRHLVAQNRATSEVFNRQELLRATLSSIGDGVITTDRQGRVTYLNQVAEKLSGWPMSEAVGRSLDDVFRIIHEKTRQPAENPCAKVLREGVVVGLANHTLLIAKDGRECPIDDSAAPIKDNRGVLFGVVLVFRDATEPRAAAEARDRLAAIVESSSDAIIGEEPDGTITSWNKAAEQLFGYTADEAIGKSIGLLVPPELREQAGRSMERIRAGQRAENIDTVRLRKDGRPIDISSHLSPVKNLYGEVIGVAKVAHDISERKRTERALRFLSDASSELATLVDYQSTMQRIARLAVPFFADWCIVDMIDANGHIERVAHAHANPDQEPLLKEFVEQYPLAWSSGALRRKSCGPPSRVCSRKCPPHSGRAS